MNEAGPKHTKSQSNPRSSRTPRKHPLLIKKETQVEFAPSPTACVAIVFCFVSGTGVVHLQCHNFPLQTANQSQIISLTGRHFDQKTLSITLGKGTQPNPPSSPSSHALFNGLLMRHLLEQFPSFKVPKKEQSIFSPRGTLQSFFSR